MTANVALTDTFDQWRVKTNEVVVMTQETSSGTISKGKEDIQEFIFKTPNETTAYSSNNIRYETYKVFAIKIALVADTTYDMPRVKDMRAIALD